MLLETNNSILWWQKNQSIRKTTTEPPKHMKPKLKELKKEIGNSTIIIVWNIDATLSIMNKTTRQKISKDSEDLNSIVHQLDLIAVYRAFHPTTAKYSFFSSIHETFSSRDQMWGHKTTLIHLQGLKSHRVCSLTTMEWNQDLKAERNLGTSKICGN